jgi:hypothetical protein
MQTDDFADLNTRGMEERGRIFAPDLARLLDCSDGQTGTIAFTAVIGVSSCRSPARETGEHAFSAHRPLTSGSNNPP